MIMEKQLFWELLHEARRIKNVLGWGENTRTAYLLGMMRTFANHYDEIRAGQNIVECWKCKADGAEGV